jgi:hypothetical protein
VSEPNAPAEAARLSRLLWDAREIAAMYGDVVASRTGQRAQYVDRVRDEIDAYRAAQGWSRVGFGGEQ